MGNRKELWDMCRAPSEIILQVGSYHRRWWAAKIKFQWGSSVLGYNVNVYRGLRCRSDCLGTSFKWVICGSLTLLDVSALTLLSVLRADVSKYRPEAYKSEKLKNPKKIHRVALVELLSEIYFLFRFDDYYWPRKIILVSGPPGRVFRVGTVSYEKIVFKIKTT